MTVRQINLAFMLIWWQEIITKIIKWGCLIFSLDSINLSNPKSKDYLNWLRKFWVGAAPLNRCCKQCIAWSDTYRLPFPEYSIRVKRVPPGKRDSHIHHHHRTVQTTAPRAPRAKIRDAITTAGRFVHLKIMQVCTPPAATRCTSIAQLAAPGNGVARKNWWLWRVSCFHNFTRVRSVLQNTGWSSWNFRNFFLYKS